MAMSDEKRMIESYEVKTAIHIGGKEIILAEDMASKDPYMVCNCQWDNPLSIQVYDKVLAGSDYLEAMTEFLGRVSSEVQHIQGQRAERGVSNEPLTASDCVPGSDGAHYGNQLVVIRPEVMVASARTADQQLLLATGGNGNDPDARGQAVFCKNLFTGKTARWERRDIAGIILPDRIPAWAHQRLAEMGIIPEKPAIPKVYMASIAEARQNGELPAYRESSELNRACAAGIQKAINDSHNGQYSYDLKAALKAVTAEFGAERVNIVLANTVDYKDYDGRFSRENKLWAQGIQLPQLTKEQRAAFVCEAHPAILDGFVNTVRKQQQEKRPSVTAQLHAPKKPSPTKKNDKARKTEAR
jgi:hypothetical protein